MSEKDEILQDWARRLAEQLGVPLEQVPVDDILALAGVAAHQVIRPAAPLTTYIVGFAAGLAAAGGQTDRPGTAMDTYADAARRLAEKVAAEREAADGASSEPGSGQASVDGSDGDAVTHGSAPDAPRPAPDETAS
ncbi:DUF6457 domain-containing protein [Tersicoccus sp. Bi-70]|uniref:DUF6457 domain-containing protein n=1 Tax=Tersicoccus sp. Bi-70 TaxID=1897634 RepID=UPI000976F3C9|nr:DUF6457 domain-containing protein [Tersicoccus sp. Bi-70]OMH34133.1 hypothetical protein BGP79_02945 [Tersicoccus sp. Bi-70]